MVTRPDPHSWPADRGGPLRRWRSRAAWSIGAVLVASAAVLIPLTCSGPESQTVAAPREMPSPADSVLAARLMVSVRGADPVLCGLAARALDQGWWSDGPRVEVGVSDSPAVREVVDWAFALHEDAGAVPGLAAGLSDADPCVRRLSARLLGRTRVPEATAALRKALGSADPATREMAAMGLGHAEDSGSLESLVAALGDPDAEVRLAAAWALGEIENPAAIEPLADILANDDAASVREAAAWALGEIE